MWGSGDQNSRGNIIEQLINSRNLTLLNDGRPTLFHSPTRSFHAVDLAMCSPSLLLDWSFDVGDDPFDSDHFPIILTSRRSPPRPEIPAAFNIRKADWTLFTSLAVLTEDMVNIVDVDTAVDIVTGAIMQTAKLSIPIRSTKLPKFPKPWWNHDCSEAEKRSKRAWGIFRRYPTGANLISF